jgi:hypothetical protein
MELITILQSSDHSGSKLFFYDSELALIRAQQSMIELGFHCLLFASNIKYEQRHFYYTILTVLFEREELKLNYVGFKEENRSCDEDAHLS